MFKTRNESFVGKKFIGKSIYIFDLDGIFVNMQIAVSKPTSNKDWKGVNFYSRLIN